MNIAALLPVRPSCRRQRTMFGIHGQLWRGQCWIIEIYHLPEFFISFIKSLIFLIWYYYYYFTSKRTIANRAYMQLYLQYKTLYDRFSSPSIDHESKINLIIIIVLAENVPNIKKKCIYMYMKTIGWSWRKLLKWRRILKTTKSVGNLYLLYKLQLTTTVFHRNQKSLFIFYNIHVYKSITLRKMRTNVIFTRLLPQRVARWFIQSKHLRKIACFRWASVAIGNASLPSRASTL